jgi:hypothetical protein
MVGVSAWRKIHIQPHLTVGNAAARHAAVPHRREEPSYRLTATRHPRKNFFLSVNYLTLLDPERCCLRVGGSGRSSGEFRLAVEALRKAILAQDKGKLEALTAEQLSYSHSNARIEDKAKFIDGIMTRKAVIKSIEFPELTVAIAGNNAIVRHLWVSESELDGKITNTNIGVLQVWRKQDSGWKLLARAAYQLPQPAERP